MWLHLHHSFGGEERIPSFHFYSLAFSVRAGVSFLSLEMTLRGIITVYILYRTSAMACMFKRGMGMAACFVCTGYGKEGGIAMTFMA